MTHPSQRRHAPAAVALLLLTLSPAALARLPVTYVGGHAMYPSRNIVQNALNSPAHTILVKAVEAAGLVKALEGRGPFTVFAPTNTAFGKLPKGTLAHLLKPSELPTLRKILLYHVVPGRWTYGRLHRLARRDGGRAFLKTLEGQKLEIILNGRHNIEVKGIKDAPVQITTYDVFQSNGVIQVVNGVLLP
jgi:uncharacterized surface protein with fasciclin (FAS1) repeats